MRVRATGATGAPRAHPHEVEITKIQFTFTHAHLVDDAAGIIHYENTPHVNSIHSRSEMLRRTLEMRHMRSDGELENSHRH